MSTVVSGSIEGWRIWRVGRLETPEGERPLRLWAAGRRGVPRLWHPGEAMRASCSRPHTLHEAPWPDCRCGVYALRSAALASRALRRYARGGAADWAIGRVSLWGRIVECEHGWRAEYAYPLDLTIFTAEREAGEELARAYGVEVATMPRPEPAVRRSRSAATSGLSMRLSVQRPGAPRWSSTVPWDPYLR